MNFVPEPRITNRRTVTAQRLAQQRNKLLRARAALVQKIKRLVEDASEDVPEYSVHPADAGTDSFDRDLNLGLASFEQEALYEVDAALRKIDTGTYGICELTGQPIPWTRLEAVPWARFTIQAETQLEHCAHPHIGSFGIMQPVSAQPTAATSEST
jgi:DnaK suppressor protein